MLENIRGQDKSIPSLGTNEHVDIALSRFLSGLRLYNLKELLPNTAKLIAKSILLS